MINPLIKSLPLIASALGQRYGVRVFIGGDKAMSDGNDIYLPSLPINSSTELLNLTRGYLDHEAAHIRETDFRTLRSARLTPVEFHVCNIIEDHRVERLLGERYPGCRQNFEWLVRRFFDEDPIQDKSLDLMILDWILLTVRGWSVPEIGARAVSLARVMEEKCPGLPGSLQPVLDGIKASCPDTGASIGHARDLVRTLQVFKEQNDKRDDLERNGLDQDRSQVSPEKGHGFSGIKNLDPVPDIGQKSSCSNDGERGMDDCLPGSKTKDTKTADKLEIASSAIEKLLGKRTDELPKSFDGLLESSLSDTANGPGHKVTVAIPSCLPLGELGQDDIAAAKKTTLLLKGRLQSLLQGLTIKPASPGLRGRLEPCLLHRVCLGSSPKVFRRKGTRTGLDVAVHLLLDASASMSRLINLACQTVYSICEALANVSGINVAATAFPGIPCQKSSRQDGHKWLTVAPMLGHGQRIHRNFQARASGNTPLAEALWWVMQEMVPLNELRKMILLVTDGEPDSPYEAKKAIKFAQDAGIELYGLGLGSDSVKGLMPGRNIVINNLMEMPRKLFGLLGQALNYKQ
ncbi:MAG: VWA domain-containing protein [Deltaproteobacteria bacterium]|jgi:hypothetical protein|nr:VWA domain-containing protein [Deltaproteobacteria bacterium]